MKEDWSSLVLQYLARRNEESLNQAIAVAPNSGIVALLKAFQQSGFADVARLAEQLAADLTAAERRDEAITVALLPTDLRARLVEYFRQFPLEQQMQALQVGMEACEGAIQLVAMLDDPPISAFYRSVIAGGFSAIREMEAARNAYEEALKIRRRLAQEQPGVYLPNVATTLNNLGTVLGDLREMEAARNAYEEALTTYRTLAQEQPGVYLPNVATTLNNLGTVLGDLREMEAARNAYEEALKIQKQLQLWLDSADTYANLGFLEDGAGNSDTARAHFEMCVDRSERGMSLLAEREHRDVFKARLESIYNWLIEDYARHAVTNGQATRERLIGLLESLRQIENVAGFGTWSDKGEASWRTALQDVMEGNGTLGHALHTHRSALLWTHVTANAVVFVTLRAGARPQVDVADRAVYDALWALLEAVVTRFEEFHRLSKAARHANAALQSPNLPEVAAIEMRKRVQPALDWMTRDVVAEAGEAAFGQLPAAVQALFTDPDAPTLFLAPCSGTVLLPYELLRTPGGDYVGLHTQIARVHGLGELAHVLIRQPEVREGRTALVVGDPTEDLTVAHKSAERLAARLEKPTTHPPFEVGLALGRNATRDAILNFLRAERPALWAYNGHGSYPDSREGAGFLCLANDGRLTPQDEVRLQLPGTFVQLDCCNVGLAQARGGGRFDSHPTALLLAGASCILSSVHPLLDGSASQLTDHLYTLLLDAENPLPVGEALMEARQAMATEKGNPLLWATTVLWGNPWARLMKY